MFGQELQFVESGANVVTEILRNKRGGNSVVLQKWVQGGNVEFEKEWEMDI